MASKVALRPEEKILREFSISPRFFWVLLVTAGFLLFVIPSFILWLLRLLQIETDQLTTLIVSTIGIGVGVVMVLYALYFRAARHYLLTTQRVVTTIGFFSQHTISAEYDDLTDISVTQDVFERFVLQAGRVSINTAGGDTQEIQLERIADPYRISDEIREYCERWLKSHRNGSSTSHPHPLPTTSSPVT